MSRNTQAGFTLLEVLISFLIIALGALGLMGLLSRAKVGEFESYQRTQALVLAQDMYDRINANRFVVDCYASLNGASTLGGGGALPTVSCTSGTTNQQNQFQTDISAWHALLNGAAETSGTNKVGAMIGARGCVEKFDPSIANAYTITVAWQGMADTSTAPTNLACGKNQYGSEARRRVITLTLRIADLTK